MRAFAAVLVCLGLLLAGCAVTQRPEPHTDFAPEQETPAAGRPPITESGEPGAREENYARELADAVIAGLAFEDKGPDEKILGIYRWLMENVYFADPVGMDIWRWRSGQQAPPAFEEAHSISPLAFGIGSCEDFACALVVLLEQSGFEALYVPGYTISVDGEYVDHAWAVVNMGGAWYHLDAQLEQNVSKRDMTDYRYFLRTDAEMLPDHKWGENLIGFWPDISENDKSAIRELYTPPACDTTYPRLSPQPLSKPPPPDIAEITRLIAEEKARKELPPLDWDTSPPVLIHPQLAGTQYARGFLSTEGQRVYDATVERALRFSIPAETPAGAGLTNGDLQDVADAIVFDNPRLYWLRFSLRSEQNGENRVFLAELRDGDTLEDAKRRDSELERAADSLMASAGRSDFDVAEAAHDGLAQNVTYDRTLAKPETANAYGALVLGEAVCDGFAKAYQFLLERNGVSCVYIRGSTIRNTTHAWNAAKLGGEWYYTDVTWDVPESNAPLRHEYLNVTTREIDLEHIAESSQYPGLPEAASSGGSYYARSGWSVRPENESRFISQLADAFYRQACADPARTADGRLYLEVKLDCPPGDYERWKQLYLKGLFDILAEMRSLAALGGGPMAAAEGEIHCNFNDSMQVLVLMPEVQ